MVPSLFQPGQFANLLRQARAGDRDALGKLLIAFRDYLREVASTAMSYEVRSRMEASDCSQIVLARAVEKFSTFNGATEPELRAWLVTILGRTVTSEWWALQAAKNYIERQLGLDDLAAADDPDVQLVDPKARPAAAISAKKQDEETGQRVLARMPEGHQQVLKLRSECESAWDEIGRRMGSTGNAARKLYGRAFADFRRAFLREC